MLPKFSIDASRLTMTLARAIRLAPWARLMLMIAGSSCGVSPTASAREKRTDSRTGRFKVHVDGEDGHHEDQRHLHEEIAEAPDAALELRLRRPQLQPFGDLAELGLRAR